MNIKILLTDISRDNTIAGTYKISVNFKTEIQAKTPNKICYKIRSDQYNFFIFTRKFKSFIRMAYLSKLFLKFFGWSYQADNRPPCKCILIAAPHTSNWDFPMMLSYGFMLNLRYHWLGKHTLFFGPLGLFMRFLGGIPVNRSKKNDYVTLLSKVIYSKRKCILIIPPEGTRSRSDYWKSGFLHIARQSAVPIVFASLDYQKRKLTFSEAVLPSLSDDKIMDIARVFYRNAKGLHPRNFGPVRLKSKSQV